MKCEEGTSKKQRLQRSISVRTDSQQMGIDFVNELNDMYENDILRKKHHGCYRVAQIKLKYNPSQTRLILLDCHWYAGGSQTVEDAQPTPELILFYSNFSWQSIIILLVLSITGSNNENGLKPFTTVSMALPNMNLRRNGVWHKT